MNRIKQSGVLLLSGFLLAACGETATDGNGDAPADLADNWTEYIQEGNENLEDYSSDTQLNLVMDMGQGLMTDEDDAFIHARIIGDLEQGYIDQGMGSLYFEGNDVYAYEGDTWNFYPDGGPIDYPSFYPNIVDSLVEIEDFVEATHTDGSIELYYDGNDPEVWDAFEDEFALSIDGVDEENINIALEAVLDDENYYLQEFRMDILGEETDGDVQLGSINIQIDVDYFDHDNVDLSDIEAEVFEENGI